LKAHTKDDIQVIREAHAHDLDGHPTPSVCTLQYVGEAPMSNFHSAFRTIWDVHGRWDHPMPAARFAKFVEQL
jgi:hypothetical protein